MYLRALIEEGGKIQYVLLSQTSHTDLRKQNICHFNL